ncbi:MAG TPA: hypothetical protein VD927_07550, partial [Chryseosolibacter sp.]|nr:hypothetical protein [Chryseosolibacter sp.]
METNADYRNWDDLVFENRNKEYGAYVLRRSYDDKVLLAMFISVSLAAFLFLIPNERRNVSVEPIFKKDHVLVLDREVVIEPRVPEKRSAPPSKPKSKKKADTPPLVTKEPVQQVAIETASVTVNSDQSAETFTQGVETTTPDVGV